MTIYTIVAALLILTGIADWWTTRRSLRAGNREVNLFWAWAQERLGERWILPKMGVHIGLAWLVWHFEHPLLLIVGVGVSLAVGYVALRNYRIAS